MTACVQLQDSLAEKIQKVATKYLRRGRGEIQRSGRSEAAAICGLGLRESLPVCIAKTQYSFTDDPKIPGAPTGWTLHVTDASLSAGAGFVVVISGNIMLMPGLPKVSRTASIDVDESGEIIGV